MIVEMKSKAGQLCDQAKNGKIKCPLIVRPTSEDVVTGQIVESLRLIDPRHWVSDFLNAALGTQQFRRQVYQDFKIRPWVGKPAFPRELLKWDEGSTEVDVQLTWENPPTTVYIEAKYGSKLSPTTANNGGEHGYPGDQLIRNIRVGLYDSGHYRNDGLFTSTTRNFTVVVLAPDVGQPLVEKYRDLDTVKASIPHADRIHWPNTPFVGEIGYAGIGRVLKARRRFTTPAERRVIDGLIEYLAYKHRTKPNRTGLPVVPPNGQLKGTTPSLL